MAEPQQQYITPEMKAKLEAELQQLIDNRPVIAAEINERREEGDLKENAGYDAAREQQDQEEARIKQISEILSNSTTERTGIVEGVDLLVRRVLVRRGAAGEGESSDGSYANQSFAGRGCNHRMILRYRKRTGKTTLHEALKL